MNTWGERCRERNKYGFVVVRCPSCDAILNLFKPNAQAGIAPICPICDLNPSLPLEKEDIQVWSGGQTGADIGGLVAAEKLGLKTGGFCPKNCRTEKGPQPILVTRFGLVETNSKESLPRTRLNIEYTNSTIIFAEMPLTGGSARTFEIADQLNKPAMVIDPESYNASGYVLNFLERHRPGRINIAGSRESKSPGIGRRVVDILYSALVKYHADNNAARSLEAS